MALRYIVVVSSARLALWQTISKESIINRPCMLYKIIQGYQKDTRIAIINQSRINPRRYKVSERIQKQVEGLY